MVIRKIGNLKVTDIHQVDIGVTIEDNKSFTRLVVADMLDVTIA